MVQVRTDMCLYPNCLAHHAAPPPMRIEPLGLPHPQDLRRNLMRQVRAEYERAVAEQGEVHVPEDTFPVQRALAIAREAFEGYARAFADAGKLVAEMQLEQLCEAMGEQDGIPNGGLTIPDREGDVRLGISTQTARDFDMGQIHAALAARVPRLAELAGTLDPERPAVEIAALVAMDLLQQVGKFEPQVTKVKAFAADLARSGDDDLAAVLRGAVRESSKFKGVTFERKQ